jgi:hypothetical protein
MGEECVRETEGNEHVSTEGWEGCGTERCRHQQRHHLLVASTSLGQSSDQRLAAPLLSCNTRATVNSMCDAFGFY